MIPWDATAAAVWRPHTFSVAVEHLTPEMMRTIFEESMPSLAALLPDSTEDMLGTRGVLQDAFQFSRMLHGAPASAGPGADALYRSFVPELASTSYHNSLPVSRLEKYVYLFTVSMRRLYASDPSFSDFRYAFVPSNASGGPVAANPWNRRKGEGVAERNSDIVQVD
ncbi:hypothetical protein EDB92DRAFT_1950956 [Lactarius akahatsu]|uniref:Uncharacterized protein n=1 Tax=Lactarius akahatsu TaxID=416441 RepID=A0AAD4LAT8_9AGAM|nr:hypothetical protein EDB92DRAFT_1950956 [Lactarius akahatsu]